MSLGPNYVPTIEEIEQLRTRVAEQALTIDRLNSEVAAKSRARAKAAKEAEPIAHALNQLVAQLQQR